MANVVELKIKSSLEVAIGRVQHLILSGYLPDPLKQDLELMTQAAMCWDLIQQKPAVPVSKGT